MRLPFALVALVTLAMLAAAPSGCRRSMAPLCRQICDCSPCTDTDLDACVTKGVAAQDAAEKSGCADTFDTLVGCLEENMSCRSGGAGPGTDQCVRADRAMVLCDGSVNPFATPCEEESVKVSACTGVAAPASLVPQGVCNGVIACDANCILAQPCEVFLGNLPAMAPLTDCTNMCQMKGNPPPPGSHHAP